MFRLTPSRVLAPKSFEEVWLGSDKMKYLKWLLLQLVAPKTKIESVITDDAFATMSEKLSTPQQFEYYLMCALEEAYKVGQKPVGTDMIDNVLAKDINGLEPRLTRQRYNAKVLPDLLNVKPREIKSFLSGHLAPGRTQELQTELLAAGIPLQPFSLMWSSSDVRAVLNKYGPTLTQCGPECPVILSECGPVIRMFLGRGVYILGPLQIVRRQPSLFEPALEGVTARNGPHFVR